MSPRFCEAGSTLAWHSSVQMKWLICYKHTGFTFLVSTHFGIFSDSVWTWLQLCGRTVAKRVDLKQFSTTVSFWCQEFLDACSCITCKFSHELPPINTHGLGGIIMHYRTDCRAPNLAAVAPAAFLCPLLLILHLKSLNCWKDRRDNHFWGVFSTTKLAHCQT